MHLSIYSTFTCLLIPINDSKYQQSHSLLPNQAARTSIAPAYIFIKDCTGCKAMHLVISKVREHKGKQYSFQ